MMNIFKILVPCNTEMKMTEKMRLKGIRWRLLGIDVLVGYDKVHMYLSATNRPDTRLKIGMLFRKERYCASLLS